MRAKVKVEPRKSKGGKKKKNKKGKNKNQKAQIKWVWKKVPRNFYVEVPKLREDGKIMKDSKGGPVVTRQWGEYTCYHIAHQEAWKQHLFRNSHLVFTGLARPIWPVLRGNIQGTCLR